ncbi:MAG: glycosyltransferase family 10 domain-containing protein [Opitutaceae bacterium]
MSELDQSRILVITVEPERKGFGKLCPDPSLRVGDWQIIINPSGPVIADFWIVFGNARPSDQIKVAPENTLLVVLEPESKKIYPKAYYRQFNYVVDTHDKSGHPNLSVEAPCFSWHVGLTLGEDKYTLGYKELSGLECPPDRKNKISVVCSDAMYTEGQRNRLLFLDGLKSRLGDRIDHYGRGFSPIDDKMDGILGYRFHLALENCCAPHYWTEKLIDSYLGWAFPVYLGCPNLSDYFPINAYYQIESMDPGRAAEAIIARLEGPPNPLEIEGLSEGRSRILNRYNPFICWGEWATKFYQEDRSKEWYVVHSHKAFRPYFQGHLFRIKNLQKRMTGPDKERSLNSEKSA